ncbi:probable RNA-binding protein EIF1AD [Palaemon carinicauda]|uniref:probable RNA-binding protein EIF1AD n=1 Tax=Palaemon carinicauda TaxID=392227 RepID=UPI0035B62E15
MSVTTKKKHVERELYEDFSLPEENQSIVRVVRARGNNLHQVATPTGEEFLVSMPPKFRKHVWIKRGNYVVTEPIPEGNKVRAEIVRILMKDHIRFLEQNGKWPSEFALQDCESKDELEVSSRLNDMKVSNEDADEISSEESEHDDDFLIENPNRPKVYFDETESSDSEEESDRETESDKEPDSDDESVSNRKVTL